MKAKVLDRLIRQNLQLSERLQALEDILRRPVPSDPVPFDYAYRRLADDDAPGLAPPMVSSRAPARHWAHAAMEAHRRIPGGGWTDPVPIDFANLRLRDIFRRLPPIPADPVPIDFAKLRLRELLPRIPGGGVTDPVPEDIGRVNLQEVLEAIPQGGVTDPGPEDIARVSSAGELDELRHRVNSRMVELQSVSGQIDRRMRELEKE